MYGSGSVFLPHRHEPNFRATAPQVSAEEFVEAMSSLLAHIDADAELDDMVQRMLHMRSDADPAHEVEPAQLADFVRGLRTHIAAAQVRVCVPESTWEGACAREQDAG